MPIVVNVDVMLARRKMTSAELAEKIGLSAVNLSIQPGDLLEFRENAE